MKFPAKFAKDAKENLKNRPGERPTPCSSRKAGAPSFGNAKGVGFPQTDAFYVSSISLSLLTLYW